MMGVEMRGGTDEAARKRQIGEAMNRIAESGLQFIRFVWCDIHGVLRGKVLVPAAAEKAMQDGLGFVSTLLLKDTSDRTAFKVFEPDGAAALPDFAFASNIMLMADPARLHPLPWAPDSAWLFADTFMPDGRPVEIDARRVLRKALRRLNAAGYGMKCGLEVEFHIYRILDAEGQEDPEQAAWPGLPPRVAMIHPGYNLLSDGWYDMAEKPMRIVRDVAAGLGLPLLSLEIEFGPSQVEAVFDVTDALTAADNMVLFRNGVRQALRRAGYHATFVCRPPFPNIMSSGWHLHQSLVDLKTGANAFRRAQPADGSDALAAGYTLSDIGGQYLAGLLEHAKGMALFCTPTPNGFARYQPNALAPQAVVWGRDNRGAMLRVVGACGDGGTRIENRIGESGANPYLYLAAQIHAGLDGIERRLEPPRATNSPYGGDHDMLPTSLGAALAALRADPVLVDAFGPGFIGYYEQLKRSELARFDAAEDKTEFQRREYFSRY